MSTEIEVAHVNKNAREELRVTLMEYKGHKLCTLRIFYLASDGKMRPGKDGVAIKVDKIDDLAKALEKAHRRAVEIGML